MPQKQSRSTDGSFVWKTTIMYWMTERATSTEQWCGVWWRTTFDSTHETVFWNSFCKSCAEMR